MLRRPPTGITLEASDLLAFEENYARRRAEEAAARQSAEGDFDIDIDDNSSSAVEPQKRSAFAKVTNANSSAAVDASRDKDSRIGVARGGGVASSAAVTPGGSSHLGSSRLTRSARSGQS